MDNSTRFAFLAFLDLISCAFGAAVLIFVVAAIASESNTGDQRPEMLVIHTEHLTGGQPEVGLKIVRPDKAVFLSTDTFEMISLNARVFSSPAGTDSVFCIVIPKPSPGTWKFTLFRVDGASELESKYRLEAFFPLGDPERQSQDVFLSSRKLAGSKPLEFTIPNLQ